MKIINFRLYNKQKIFICIKFKNNYSQVYSLTDQIERYNLNTKKKILNHILKLKIKDTKYICLYKIYNSDKYNKKWIESIQTN
jgi:hypothetical protein